MRISVALGVFALLLVGASGPLAAQTPNYEKLRQELVDDVLVPGGITDARVLDAVRNTLRHEFVAAPHRKHAYFDMALPIGERQTISSPFIVAYMTQSLDPRPEHKVLEIGTGSGYQAAVLSPLVKEVYSIEIVEPLGKLAALTLKRLGYQNVHTKVGDGFQGWAEHAPFDRIIVTCSPEKVPQPLADQLAEGGLMVVPVGERYQQTLYLIRKTNGKLEPAALRPTLFVPMTGRAEENRQVKPDPLHPTVINGGFEDEPGEERYVPGWYYEQQSRRTADAGAPEGRHYLQFTNREAGRSAHILQGFAIDGRSISELTISARVRLNNVQPGKEKDELPRVAVSFYDHNRKELGTWWIGPFKGTQDWHAVSEKFRVPAGAREGILRLGLFGATGEAAFDDLRFQYSRPKP